VLVLLKAGVQKDHPAAWRQCQAARACLEVTRRCRRSGLCNRRLQLVVIALHARESAERLVYLRYQLLLAIEVCHGAAEAGVPRWPCADAPRRLGCMQGLSAVCLRLAAWETAIVTPRSKLLSW
jgi:hypothetical protein